MEPIASLHNLTCGESLAEDVQPPGCAKDPCYQMTGMRGARGGRVTQDVTSQENSTNQNSTLSVLNFFHFHSTPFLLLSPFPFTHQNCINCVILIIMISLVLSDEGSRNTPKAYKQVLTLMAGVSTEVISQTLSRPNLSPDLPIHYLVRFSVHRLDHFPYLLHNLMSQSGHPGPREVEPCPEEDL